MLSGGPRDPDDHTGLLPCADPTRGGGGGGSAQPQIELLSACPNGRGHGTSAFSSICGLRVVRFCRNRVVVTDDRLPATGSAFDRDDAGRVGRVGLDMFL